MPEIHDVKTEGPLGDELRSIFERESAGSPCCELLKRLSSKKYQLILAYIHYGDQLRAFFRDGIFAHFQEHLDEERAQLYQINKKITAMGGDAPCEPLPIPSVPMNDAAAMMRALRSMEQESMELWSELFRQTDDDVALNGMAQNYATECQGHADDLTRYLRSCE
jgi:hypothetical protein